ncbi:hypothetical protein CO615_04670 [Lysobacteraceae bacterium NML75-0749]|nr:hypothetical protein CO615_04670 [Xanthomonadaceae bacterium NML75-0749]
MALVREYAMLHAKNCGASGNDAAVAARHGLRALGAGYSVARACAMVRDAIKRMRRSNAV